ncbi:putative capsular polysaccharide synthesis family protein [Candidatus Woesearchaeota archaeon]|nr:putative capsular polysaccharide synthesis family protein [Candidatus Woesearchaeota archaeon]
MKNKSEIFIITLVRDILSQNVSYFFQKHSKFLNDLSGKNNLSIEELQSVYLNKDLIYTLPRFINWFDSELKVVTGIDVFSYDFDISKGYSIIKKDNVNLLIIRMEDLNCVFSEAINQFLGVHLELKNSNQSENKKYSELYSEFKNTLNFNQELISQAYNSKLMKHFYSQEEIDSFMIKWNKNNI